jgi:ribosomal protein L28
MFKTCIVCGKKFECYNSKSHSRGGRLRKYKRAFNWKTCSHKCSVLNSHKGEKRCEENGCKNKGVGFINCKYLCAKHIKIEKYGEPKITSKWMSEKIKKDIIKKYGAK